MQKGRKDWKVEIMEKSSWPEKLEKVASFPRSLKKQWLPKLSYTSSSLTLNKLFQSVYKVYLSTETDLLTVLSNIRIVHLLRSSTCQQCLTR